MASILLVDDDERVLDLLKRDLERAGHIVHTCISFEEALSLLKKQSFDLTVTDIIMDSQDGFDVIKHLKRDHPAMRIVAMSGGGQIAPGLYLKAAEALGANLAVTKASLLKNVAATIETAL